MNAVNYALNEIKLRIPKPIRNYTFVKSIPEYHYNLFSEEQQIRSQVLDNKVLIDCDLVGGEELIIPFENVPFRELDSGKVIYKLPREKLQGRRLMSAMSVSTGDHRLDTYSNAYYPTSSLHDAASKLLGANTADAGTTTNRVKKIGDNLVLVEDRLTFNQLYLRCVLSYDRGLINFSPRAFPNLAHLSVLACKSIIYNNSVLEIDASQLMGGVSIGRFREIVDSYSGSSQEYDEYLKNIFTKVLFQQDKESHSRHLRMLTGGLVN